MYKPGDYVHHRSVVRGDIQPLGLVTSADSRSIYALWLSCSGRAVVGPLWTTEDNLEFAEGEPCDVLKEAYVRRLIEEQVNG